MRALGCAPQSSDLHRDQQTYVIVFPVPFNEGTDQHVEYSTCIFFSFSTTGKRGIGFFKVTSQAVSGVQIPVAGLGGAFACR